MRNGSDVARTTVTVSYCDGVNENFDDTLLIGNYAGAKRLVRCDDKWLNFFTQL